MNKNVYKFNSASSLEQLEKDKWEEPNEFSPGLVERCFQYRKIPVKDLTVEQLRALIGQNIGLKFLIPVAFDVLKENILAEGDFYSGDLLNAVISSIKEFWINNKELYHELVILLNESSELLTSEVDTRQFHRNFEAFKTMMD